MLLLYGICCATLGFIMGMATNDWSEDENTVDGEEVKGF